MASAANAESNALANSDHNMDTSGNADAEGDADELLEAVDITEANMSGPRRFKNAIIIARLRPDGMCLVCTLCSRKTVSEMQIPS